MLHCRDLILIISYQAFSVGRQTSKAGRNSKAAAAILRYLSSTIEYVYSAEQYMQNANILIPIIFDALSIFRYFTKKTY
jgi:hypothetical protein